MLLTDLPYGSTDNPWDVVIPLDRLWDEWNRVLKRNGVIALTAMQPLSSKLVMSKLKWFRHEWIWVKNTPTNFLNSNKAPMRTHESVLIFTNNGIGTHTYNPQKELRFVHTKDKRDYNSRTITATIKNNTHPSTNWRPTVDPNYILKENRMYTKPRTTQSFRTEKGIHPTQKPVSLFEYLIKTYTNKDEVVLDCCAGSGTAAIASIRANRRFILIERDQKYLGYIKERLKPYTSFLPIVFG